MKKLLCILLSALLLALCAGCGGNHEPSPDQSAGTGENQSQTADPNQGGTEPAGGQTPPAGQDAAASNIYEGITGIAPGETVLTVGGTQVPAQLYFYWLSSTAGQLEYQLYMGYQYYGAGAGLFDEAGQLNWDAQYTEDQTLGQYVKAAAEDTVLFYAALEDLAAENGVSMTDADTADLQSTMDSLTTQVGGEEGMRTELDLIGLTREAYERLLSSRYLFSHLVDLALQADSPLYLADSGCDAYGTYADHILLATIDLNTREALSEEEIAAKYATAQNLLARLQDADDVESLFTSLADEYSEDTGRVANPDGYIYTPGTMVTEFEDAAAALEPGQISGIVETSYGYHIILRKDLAKGLAAHPEQKAVLAPSHMEALIRARIEDTDVVRSEKLDGIDGGAFYTAYTAAAQAMEAANAGTEDGGAPAGE